MRSVLWKSSRPATNVLRRYLSRSNTCPPCISLWEGGMPLHARGPQAPSRNADTLPRPSPWWRTWKAASGEWERGPRKNNNLDQGLQLRQSALPLARQHWHAMDAVRRQQRCERAQGTDQQTHAAYRQRVPWTAKACRAQSAGKRRRQQPARALVLLVVHVKRQEVAGQCIVRHPVARKEPLAKLHTSNRALQQSNMCTPPRSACPAHSTTPPGSRSPSHGTARTVRVRPAMRVSDLASCPVQITCRMSPDRFWHTGTQSLSKCTASRRS